MEPKTELSREEMTAIFEERVKEAFGLSVTEYLHARDAGTLPQTTAGIALAVFSGEAGNGQLEPAGEDRNGGSGPVSLLYTEIAGVRKSKRPFIRRAIAFGLRKLHIPFAPRTAHPS